MDREAIEEAIEVLEDASADMLTETGDENYYAEAIAALRQALEQEPVAWMHTTGTGHVYFRKKPQDKVFNPRPVYTAPPKQWVGLTDEEIDALSQARSLTDELMDCVDRLGSEADTVDPRVWQHLLVYAPKQLEQEPVAWTSSLDFDDDDQEIIPAKDKGKLGTSNCDIPLYTAPPKREWVGLSHFDRTLLRTTYAPLKRLHHIKETKMDIVAEIVNDWDAFFTAIEAKLKEGNTYDAISSNQVGKNVCTNLAAAIRARGNT